MYPCSSLLCGVHPEIPNRALTLESGTQEEESCTQTLDAGNARHKSGTHILEAST